MNGGTARVSRRTLIKTSLAGLGVAIAGGAGLALQKTVLLAQTPAALQVLDPAEYAVLVAITDRVCPAVGPGAPGGIALRVPELLDRILLDTDIEMQKGIKVALKLLDNALTGALTGERLVPFTKLTAEQQDRSLARWRDADSGFRRTVYGGVASAINSVYWGQKETWARLGYKGPPDIAGLRAAYADQLVDLNSLRATPVVVKGT
jgi:hypothetical protein